MSRKIRYGTISQKTKLYLLKGLIQDNVLYVFGVRLMRHPSEPSTGLEIMKQSKAIGVNGKEGLRSLPPQVSTLRKQVRHQRDRVKCSSVKLNQRLLITIERRSASPSFIPDERLQKYVEDTKKTAVFRTTTNITGNCLQEEMEGDAHKTNKRESTSIGTWNVRTLNQCEKIKELSYALHKYKICTCAVHRSALLM